MPDVVDQTPAEDTRRKLIEAAGEIFAAHGFHEATVGEIADRAGVNGAAVDYHFRDKSELYGAVLGECRFAALEEAGEWRCDSEDPGDQLQHFIDRFTRRLLNPRRPHWHHALVSREMLEPTGALDQMVEQAIRPDARELEGIIHQLTGGDLPRDRVMMLSFSVVAQCLFYLHNRAIIERIYPKFRNSPPTVEQIVEHVFAFSITAIREFASPA
ncbi:MAG: CerR family C-terminal domain-containing protein [Verrucomicrobiota bacterium]|nr:CerR family C-terminal domain-containing protein [Verrucomicrobiota bacterium]